MWYIMYVKKSEEQMKMLKPLTKAEQVYLKKLQNRPSETVFNEVFSKAQNYHTSPKEVKSNDRVSE